MKTLKSLRNKIRSSNFLFKDIRINLIKISNFANVEFRQISKLKSYIYSRYIYYFTLSKICRKVLLLNSFSYIFIKSLIIIFIYNLIFNIIN